MARTSSKNQAQAGTPTKKKAHKWTPKTTISSPNRKNKKTQILNLYEILGTSALELGLSVAICFRPVGDNQPPEASFTHHMKRIHNDEVHGSKYAELFQTLMFAPRRDNMFSNDVKKSKNYDWYLQVVMLEEGQTLEQAGHKIAKAFTKFTKDQKMSQMKDGDVYTFNAALTKDPKPLNHYMLDEDTAKVLKTLYAEYTKGELMEDEDIMTTFFGGVGAGKDVLDSMDEDEWEDLLD